MNKTLKTLKIIERQIQGFRVPSVTVVSQRKDPYLVLVSCLLSLRTKDKTTTEASQRLFRVADTPQKMIKIPRRYLEKLIYPVGFYRHKAKAILRLSKSIIEYFRGRVPDRREDLLGLAGVGRKTANLVFGLGFGIPAICVDTHVHRIANRLGWVKTKSPEQSEYALEKIISQKYWIGLNTILVTFGQHICVPVSPYCSRCQARNSCKRIEVARSR